MNDIPNELGSRKRTFNLRDALESKMNSQQVNDAQQLATKWWEKFGDRQK